MFLALSISNNSNKDYYYIKNKREETIYKKITIKIIIDKSSLVSNFFGSNFCVTFIFNTIILFLFNIYRFTLVIYVAETYYTVQFIKFNNIKYLHNVECRYIVQI